jgi:hypothetical protein
MLYFSRPLLHSALVAYLVPFFASVIGFVAAIGDVSAQVRNAIAGPFFFFSQFTTCPVW